MFSSKNIPVFEMAFLTICEDESLTEQKNKQKLIDCLDKVWIAPLNKGNEDENQSISEIRTKQIIFAGKSAGYSPLHLLAEQGNAEALRWYFERYDEEKKAGRKVPFIDLEDKDGHTPLFLACQKGFKGELSQYVSATNETTSSETIDHFIEIGQKNLQIESNRLKIVKLLLMHNANVNFKTEKLGMTALHWAATHGDKQVVYELINFNAEHQRSLEQKLYPIDLAGSCNKREIVKVLCQEMAYIIFKEKISRDDMISDSKSKKKGKQNNKIFGKIYNSGCVSKFAQEFKTLTSQELNEFFLNDQRDKGQDQKKVINCKVISHRKLKHLRIEENRLRIFYWAAFHGLTQYVRLMIIHYKWSPFIKSYQKKSVLVAAIQGQQIETAQMILEYNYEITDSYILMESEGDSLAARLKVYGKDKDDNNILHHIYANGGKMSEVKTLLNQQFPWNKKKKAKQAELNRDSQDRSSASLVSMKQLSSSRICVSCRPNTRSEKELKLREFGDRMNRIGLQPKELLHSKQSLLKLKILRQQQIDEGLDTNNLFSQEDFKATQNLQYSKNDYPNLDDEQEGCHVSKKVRMVEELLDTTICFKKDNLPFKNMLNHPKCVLSPQEKLALYQSPVHCFVCKAETVKVLLHALHSLFVRQDVKNQILNQRHVFYNLYPVLDMDNPQNFQEKKQFKDLKEKVRVVLYFDDIIMDQMAEALKIQTRVKKYDCLLPFKAGEKTREFFHRFNGRQIQSIVSCTLSEHIDLPYLIKNGVISEHFPMHLSDREDIITSWSEYKYRLSRGFVTGDFLENMCPLNVIKDYYGEKMAFYFAWLIHYTGWLIIPSLFGLIFGAISLKHGTSQDLEIKNTFMENLNTPVSFLYGICLMIWLTAFNESWKRKQSIIADIWLVRNFEDVTNECKNYKSEVTVCPETQDTKKVAKNSYQWLQITAGFCTSLFFVTLVILCQVILVYASSTVVDLDPFEDQAILHDLWQFAPAIINVALIGVFTLIYRKICPILVKLENHHYEQEEENSLINKIYMFDFVNNYISNFVYIFYYQDFAKLQLNLIIIITSKKVVFVIVEYLISRCTVERRINNIKCVFNKLLIERNLEDSKIASLRGEQRVNKLIEQADHKTHQDVEEQIQMTNRPATLVYFYKDTVIQMGFVAFFGVSFPFAPIFAFLAHLATIRLKLYIMTKTVRRGNAICSSGIGNWQSIVNFITFIAIPINMSVILFARNPGEDTEVGISQDHDHLTNEQQPQITQFLQDRGTYWTRTNILLLVVAVEHILIMLKDFIDLLILDVPHKVRINERNRKLFESQANNMINQVSKTSNLNEFAKVMMEQVAQKFNETVREEQMRLSHQEVQGQEENFYQRIQLKFFQNITSNCEEIANEAQQTFAKNLKLSKKLAKKKPQSPQQIKERQSSDIHRKRTSVQEKNSKNQMNYKIRNFSSSSTTHLPPIDKKHGHELSSQGLLQESNSEAKDLEQPSHQSYVLKYSRGQMNMVKREGKITKEQSRVIEQSFDPISRLTSNTKIHAENE